jgi:replicative DNA helicase
MNAPDLPRLPPHSIEAEQAVLGGLLLDNTAMDRIADLIRAEDFYRHDHRTIFGEIASQIGAGKTCDVITVAEALDRAESAWRGRRFALPVRPDRQHSQRREHPALMPKQSGNCSVLRHIATVGVEIAEAAYSPVRTPCRDSRPR